MVTRGSKLIDVALVYKHFLSLLFLLYLCVLSNQTYLKLEYFILILLGKKINPMSKLDVLETSRFLIPKRKLYRPSTILQNSSSDHPKMHPFWKGQVVFSSWWHWWVECSHSSSLYSMFERVDRIVRELDASPKLRLDPLARHPRLLQVCFAGCCFSPALKNREPVSKADIDTQK